MLIPVCVYVRVYCRIRCKFGETMLDLFRFFLVVGLSCLNLCSLFHRFICFLKLQRFYFFQYCIILLFMCAQSFIIHSSVDIHLTLLYFLSMLNRAEINKNMQITLQEVWTTAQMQKKNTESFNSSTVKLLRNLQINTVIME